MMKFEKVSQLRAKFPFVERFSKGFNPPLEEPVEEPIEKESDEIFPEKIEEPEFHRCRHVIDASICGIEGILGRLKDIMSNGEIIVLTSITIRELEQMQKFKDISGRDAKQLLAIAAENPESTECVLIDEDFPIADDAIINYCAQHKEEIILLTSDKTMALKARSFGCEVEYLKQDPELNNQVRTLYAAKSVGNKLVIDDLQNAYRSITVISGGRIYTQGHMELHIGDNLFICSRKGYGGIMFTHFKVLNLDEVDNVLQVYHRRISYNESLKELSTIYVDIIRDFKRRFDM